MCTGISLAISEVPVALFVENDLHSRWIERGGVAEVRFLYQDEPRVLPVWYEGQLRLVRWGVRRNESRRLPCTGWTWQATVEAGRWAETDAEPVVIPASFGLERGIWFRIREGIRGLLARDEHGREAVYMLCEPASHYFAVMTRSSRMPVLIGERY
jgi:hypothetical protein